MRFVLNLIVRTWQEPFCHPIHRAHVSVACARCTGSSALVGSGRSPGGVAGVLVGRSLSFCA